MAGASSPDARAKAYTQLPYLSSEQQTRLLAALASNKRNVMLESGSGNGPTVRSNSTDGVDPSIFTVQPGNTPGSSGYKTGSNRHTFGSNLFQDFENGTNFDIDFSAGDADFSLTGSDFLNEPSELYSGDQLDGESGEAGEKRKSPEDESDAEDGDYKRQEGDDKVAKKPGRKLITAEPTTKRKAQNRAAQRAFRDRKEKHLKDLELKVAELEKKTDSVDQQNGLLKAQNHRLQTELKEYRQRLSNAGSGFATSPPTVSYIPKRGSSGGPSDFTFDFARFGGNSAPQYSNNGPPPPLTNGASQSSSRSTRSASPKDIQAAFVSAWTAPSNITNGSGSAKQTDDLFSPSFFGGLAAGSNYNTWPAGQAPQNPPALASTNERSAPRHKSTTSSYQSDSNSPPGSTTSPNDPSSSCCTSPGSNQVYANEPTTTSDATYNLNENTLVPITTSAFTAEPAYDFGNFDWLATQNGGQFDPVLFGDYRESQDAVVGGGDFSSGFFEDPYGLGELGANDLDFDITSTTNVAPGMTSQTLPLTPSSVESATATRVGKALMENVARCREGKDSDEMAMMTANTIWSELQTCPKFISGDLDIDGLCTELSKKATCSETGLAIRKDVVEKALWRLVGCEDGGNAATAAQLKEEQYKDMRSAGEKAKTGL